MSTARPACHGTLLHIRIVMLGRRADNDWSNGLGFGNCDQLDCLKTCRHEDASPGDMHLGSYRCPKPLFPIVYFHKSDVSSS